MIAASSIFCWTTSTGRSIQTFGWNSSVVDAIG